MQDIAFDSSMAAAGLPIRRILGSAAVAGTLDLMFAAALWYPKGVPPKAIFQSIASGLLGPDAFAGGWGVAALGIGLHFAIMLIIAALYASLVPAWLQARPLLAGALLGLTIWTVMNLVVVPLSAAPLSLPPFWIGAADMAGHMFLVGMPIAWLIARASPG